MSQIWCIKFGEYAEQMASKNQNTSAFKTS